MTNPPWIYTYFVLPFFLFVLYLMASIRNSNQKIYFYHRLHPKDNFNYTFFSPFLSVKSNFQSEIFAAKVIKSGQVMNFKFWDFKNLKHLLVINSVVKILLPIIWETMIASNQFYSL